MTSASALGIPGLGQTLAAGTWPPVLLSPRSRSLSFPQGRVRPSLSFGLAACPRPGKGKAEAQPGACPVARPDRPRTLCPEREAALGCSCSSWEGQDPSLPSLPRGQHPCGSQPQDLPVPLKLSPPPAPPPQRPEKMSQVLGKRGSSWGPGPSGPNRFGLGVCLLEDSLPFPPIPRSHTPSCILPHTPSSS